MAKSVPAGAGSAAHASAHVVAYSAGMAVASKTRSDESLGEISVAISVQPRIIPAAPRAASRSVTSGRATPRFLEHPPAAQPREADAMCLNAPLGVRDTHLEPVPPQSIDVECDLHREPGSQRPDHGQAAGRDCRGGRLDDVRQRDPDRALGRRSGLVQRVRAQHESLRAGALEVACNPGEERTRVVPPVRPRDCLDLGDVEAREQDLRRVQAAEPRSDHLVDEPVVRDDRLPAHSSEPAEELHRDRRSCGISTALSARPAPRPPGSGDAGRVAETDWPASPVLAESRVSEQRRAISGA